MASLSGLRRILLPPRDAEFFTLFARMADTLVAGGAAVQELLAAEDQARIDERQRARAAKDFARSDAIRRELLERGIILEDTKDGVRWKRVAPPKA